MLLLDNAGVLDAGEIFSTWWPTILILAGILSFAANPRHWPGALIITGVGVAFLLSNLDMVDIGSVVIPAAIILVGILVHLRTWPRTRGPRPATRQQLQCVLRQRDRVALEAVPGRQHLGGVRRGRGGSP